MHKPAHRHNAGQIADGYERRKPPSAHDERGLYKRAIPGGIHIEAIRAKSRHDERAEQSRYDSEHTLQVFHG